MSKGMETIRSTRTLIVDDSDYMRQMLVMMLKKLGITDIVQARDGVEAMTVLHAGGIGLMLLDCVMPKISGLDVLKSIRADPVLASLPVILVTANADDETFKAAQAPDVRADAIVVKPLSIATLKSTLERLPGN